MSLVTPQGSYDLEVWFAKHCGGRAAQCDSPAEKAGRTVAPCQPHCCSPLSSGGSAASHGLALGPGVTAAGSALVSSAPAAAASAAAVVANVAARSTENVAEVAPGAVSSARAVAGTRQRAW